MYDIPCYVSAALRKKEKEEAEWLERRPICSECGEPIQDEQFYLFDDKKICPGCMEAHLEWTEDFEYSED